jgi:hypothetical protein
MRSTPSLLGCLFLTLFLGCGSDEPNGWRCDNATVAHGTQTVCDVPSFGGPISHYTCLPAPNYMSPKDYRTVSAPAPEGGGGACPPGTTPAGPNGSTSDGPGDSSLIDCTSSGDTVHCTSTACDPGYHASACGACVPDSCSSCDCGTHDGTGADSGAGNGGTGGCTLTQGYWKNHASAWPVTSLTLGGATYSQAQLLTILGTPAGGDASLILAHQLIATLLNAASGAGQGPIGGVVAQAQAWLSANAGGKLLPYGVSASSAAGAQAVALANQLDAYNNGLAGVSHCK